MTPLTIAVLGFSGALFIRIVIVFIRPTEESDPPRTPIFDFGVTPMLSGIFTGVYFTYLDAEPNTLFMRLRQVHRH